MSQMYSKPASRCSEIYTKVAPYEIAHDKTRPYGRYLRFKFADCDLEYGKKEKVLLHQFAVAKRLKKLEEGKLKLTFIVVGLPCQATYEPWVTDLLRYIRDQSAEIKVEDRLQFNLTRMSVQNVVKRNLRPFFPNIYPHSLRHHRITHLITNYGFSPCQITAYTRANARQA